MMATKLSSALVAPSKVANILDWRRAVGAVMGLDITRDRIGIAVAEHPEHLCGSVPLPSLPLLGSGTTTPSRLDERALSELEDEVRRHRVCAFVVNWPVREGRTGEGCGRVLRVLDCVVSGSNAVVTRKRPFTLWRDLDSLSREPSPVDEWGRSADFARAPEYVEGMTYSSKSGLVDPSSSSSSSSSSLADGSEVAASLLDEWVRDHWAIDGRTGKAATPKEAAASNFFFSTRSVDEYSSESACLQVALL